ncbi:MAG: NAD(P)-dependent glycerol-3-phosphate dehydrogenase [Desulfovibrio sp.]|jgi:glycerol-3-phosphate dehydrogenase (NAD(P)+)|nr:NAD(P)-dependent glycerol-3-phosphate dehydrogenase [Desulfovibrio sp.]
MGNESSITVAGGGSWGTALAHLLAERHSATLWLRDPDVAEAISKDHVNPRYLPGLPLHPELVATTDPAALAADILVLAIPIQRLREWLRANRKNLRPGQIVVNAAKGMELDTLSLPATVVSSEIQKPAPPYATISGPSFASEVVLGSPTAVVLASRDEALARDLRNRFATPVFRCYSSSDCKGVELGGAIKNVMAIAAGLCDGLEYGHNSRAALVTRGLAEMSRIGRECGARQYTFMGLSGLGDLLLTCTSDLSRNRQVGLALARGESLDQVTGRLGMVAEGVATTAAMRKFARIRGLRAPIVEAVHSILHGGHDPRQVVKELLARTLKEE